MSSHNTIIVNNNPIQTFEGQWKVIKKPHLLKDNVTINNDIIKIVGLYTDDFNNCEIERKIVISDKKSKFLIQLTNKWMQKCIWY